MSGSDREGLIARIRQIRRAAAPSEEPGAHLAAPSEQDRLSALQTRVEHVEQLVQGLQDSVHRESLRYDKRITELEAQIQPAALGKALSEDARTRGL